MTGRMTPGRVPDPWGLTARISPRRVVRAASRDAAGQPVNCYPLLHPVSGAEPDTPWAVHLTDQKGRFRLLCADLDATTSHGEAHRDADRLSGLLTELRIAHVVCASGPTGGRHVWLALTDLIDPPMVAALARLLKAWLPTLDTAPLLNPKTGCVRPPGSPTDPAAPPRILTGSTRVLTTPQVRGSDIEALLARLAHQINTTAPPASQPGTASVTQPGITDGIPHLIGPQRPLPPITQQLLETGPSTDASAVLWRLLCSAALARWQFADVLEVLDRPGLEHARTLNTGSTRTARPATGPTSPRAVLLRQWTRAVHATTRPTNPHQTSRPTDPTFDARAETVTGLVQVVQSRADHTPGRWRGRRGHAHRRVLDALCLLHLRAVRTEVEADIRRLALTCGLDRETCRRALLDLADSGWIRRTRPSHGTRGAVWTIDPHGTIHSHISETLSQGNPRPPGTGSALRTVAIHDLADRLDSAAHDTFAGYGGLGVEAGSLYGRLAQPHSTLSVARLMCWDTTTAEAHLPPASPPPGSSFERAAAGHGTSTTHLDQLATVLGTAGHGARRAQLYTLERQLWAWWLAEITWMRSPRTTPHVPPSRASPPPAPPTFVAHPRKQRRADYRAARTALIAGRHTTGHLHGLTPPRQPDANPTRRAQHVAKSTPAPGRRCRCRRVHRATTPRNLAVQTLEPTGIDLTPARLESVPTPGGTPRSPTFRNGSQAHRPQTASPQTSWKVLRPKCPNLGSELA
ncbi:MAG: hypothetical protein IPL43_00175 [Micropruina sp.]|nr:hypothetical protein [Micropruina sp.]